jgi:dTDP-4-amino-4,6-dideoxygalactose transaminase
LPTTCGGQLVGTLGSDATVFSFYANKTITTGEGGMLVTRDAALAKRARVMRLHGMNRDAFDRYTAKVPSWYYEVVAPGFKYNLTDIAAALGLQQLKKARAFQQRRERIAAIYDAAFADLPLLRPPRHGPATSMPGTCTCCAWTMAPASSATASSSGCSTPASAAACTTSRCTCTRTGASAMRCDPSMFPQAQKAYERMFSLPLYTRMDDADVQRVVDAVRAILG